MTLKELEKRLRELQELHDLYHKHEDGYFCPCGAERPYKIIDETGFIRFMETHNDVPITLLIEYLIEHKFTFTKYAAYAIASLSSLSDEDIKRLFKRVDFKIFEAFCDARPRLVNLFYQCLNTSLAKVRMVIEKNFKEFNEKEWYLKRYTVVSRILDEIIYASPDPTLIQLHGQRKYTILLDTCDTKQKAEKMCQFLRHNFSKCTNLVKPYINVKRINWLFENGYYGLAFLLDKQTTVLYLLEKFGTINIQFTNEFDKEFFAKIKLNEIGVNEDGDPNELLYFNKKFYKIEEGK